MTDTAMPTVGGWRATYLARQPVVNVNGGHTLGEVADLVFDPGTSTLAGLLVAPTGHGASLLEVARRAFGGSMGLTYVDLAHVLALNADVVTVDLGEKPAASPRGPLPRLSAVVGFSVITLHGRRLGHLVDLLLDAEGRRILGYLIAPPTAAPGGTVQPAPPLSDASDGDLPEMVHVEPAEPATTPAASLAPSAPQLIAVASDQNIRVGRDLIIVTGTQATDQPTVPGAHQGETPFALRRQASQPGASAGAQPVQDSGWQVYEPDAPTEQIHM